jgi:hypothetical protein
MQDEITIMVREHTRLVRRREVHYTCRQCGQACCVQQYLGRPPLYCADCRQQLGRWRRQDDRDAAAERMRYLRASRRTSQPAQQPDHNTLQMLHPSWGYQHA